MTMINIRQLIMAGAVLVAPGCFAASGPDKDLASIKASLEARLIQSLDRNQSAITMDEYDFISALSRQPGISELVYFNKYGEIRWYKDPAKITMAYDRFARDVVQPTDVVQTSVISKAPMSKPIPNGETRHVAIPLLSNGEVAGTVALQATNQTLDSLVRFFRTQKRQPAQKSKSNPQPGSRPPKVDEEPRMQSQQHYLSGVVFFQKGDYDKARAEWVLSIKLDPNNNSARDGIQRLDKLGK